MDTVKAFVGQATTAAGGGEDDAGFMEGLQDHLSLSKKHRLIGFGACLGLGILLLFIATTQFLFPTKFAFTYTIANILLVGRVESSVFIIGKMPLPQTSFPSWGLSWSSNALSGLHVSTMFLIGPIKQLKMMFDPVRLCATFAYLISLFLAFFCALKLQNFFLTIIAIIIEAVAISWYALSYVPFARSMAKTALGSCFPSVF